MELTGRLSTDEQGDPLLVVNARDITVQIRMRAALRESGEMYRAVLNATPQAIVAVNQDGEIVYANPGVREIFGYDRRELLGRPVEVLIPARSAEQHVAMAGAFMAGPRGRAMGSVRQLYGQRRDGSEVPLEITLSSVSTSAGKLVYAICTDVTERRDTSVALREAEKRAQLLLEHTPDLVASFAPTGLLWPTPQCNVPGIASGEVGQIAINDIVASQISLMTGWAIPEAVRTGSWSGEVSPRAVWGTVPVSSWWWRTRRDAEGPFDHRSRPDPAHPPRNSWREANRRAGEPAKSTFVAAMSHEPRTPISAVIGMTEPCWTPSGAPSDYVRPLIRGDGLRPSSATS